MQIVQERHSIDKPLTFNIGLLQLIFHTSVFTHLIHMHVKVFSIQIFQYLRQIPPRVCTLVLSFDYDQGLPKCLYKQEFRVKCVHVNACPLHGT